MTKTAMVVSMICGFALAAPAVSADDGMGAYNEDLSAYGQPRPTGHGTHWQRQVASRPVVVDAKTVQALRVANSDDGLGAYTEDLSGYGTTEAVIFTLAATD